VQSVHNRGTRDNSELHQSRGGVKCKSQNMLEHQELQKCSITLKIRRASALGGSTPPPGTNAKSRIKHCTLLNVLRARLQILPRRPPPEVER
jgi:hypothetical protein